VCTCPLPSGLPVWPLRVPGLMGHQGSAEPGARSLWETAYGQHDTATGGNNGLGGRPRHTHCPASGSENLNTHRRTFSADSHFLHSCFVYYELLRDLKIVANTHQKLITREEDKSECVCLSVSLCVQYKPGQTRVCVCVGMFIQ